MVDSTIQVVASPTVVAAEETLEATTSSRVAAAAPRAAGRPATIPSRPEFAHDMSMNETTE